MHASVDGSAWQWEYPESEVRVPHFGESTSMSNSRTRRSVSLILSCLICLLLLYFVLLDYYHQLVFCLLVITHYAVHLIVFCCPVFQAEILSDNVRDALLKCNQAIGLRLAHRSLASIRQDSCAPSSSCSSPSSLVTALWHVAAQQRGDAMC